MNTDDLKWNLEKSYKLFYVDLPEDEFITIERRIGISFEEFFCCFEEYSMVLMDCASIIIMNEEKKINEYTIGYLNNSFFESYPQFKVLEEDLINYPIINTILKNHENNRYVILKLLNLNCNHPENKTQSMSKNG
jgi:hypothetical protein